MLISQSILLRRALPGVPIALPESGGIKTRLLTSLNNYDCVKETEGLNSQEGKSTITNLALMLPERWIYRPKAQT